jgi:hypothetical protein
MAVNPTIYNNVQPVPSPFATMEEVARAKNAQLVQQLNQFKIQDEQEKRAQKQKDDQSKAMLNAAIGHALNPDGSINRELFTKEITASGFSDPAGALLGLDEFEESSAKAHKAINDKTLSDVDVDNAHAEVAGKLGRQMQYMLDHGATPDDVAGAGVTGMARIKNLGLSSEDETVAIVNQMDPSNPDALKSVIGKLMSADTAGVAKAEADALKLKTEGLQATHAQQVVEGTEPITPFQNAQLAKQAEDDKRLAEQAAETHRHNVKMENRPVGGAAGAGAAGQKSGLSEESLNQAADKYFETGTLPSLGMGTAAANDKRAIMERAGERHPGGALAFNSAAYKANAATLSKLTQQNAALKSFEATGLKNLENFTNIAKSIPDTGIPWLNTPVRSLSQNLVGATNMPAVNAAREVALTEIARIVSNPNLTGVLSDSAREEVRGLIPANATFKQIKRVAEVLQQDMMNRRTSMDEQIADIEAKLHGTPAVTPDQAVKPTGKVPTKRYNPATGKVEDIK